MEPTSTYRADIDGLRAIAVLAVVFYHFGLWPFAGGFVGVDVFFVISGFLITGIIDKEARERRFSFAKFYERRARRILPALLTVIAATLIGGYIILMPGDFLPLGWQSLCAMAGISNFWFYWNSGYFDQAAEFLPLLHTWSLGVEEQFYVFWPLLLLGIYKFSRNARRDVLLALALIIAASFASAQIALGLDKSFAFFMLPTRAWELALGAALCFAPVIRSRRLGAVLGAIGLAAIIASLVLYTEATPFPGLAALPACLGAALIVWPRNEGDAVSGVLSWAPIVFVGKISYSLYLWHWPIAVAYRYTAFDRELGLFDALATIALSVALATASWRFIEQPFRRRQSWNFRWILVALGAPLAVLTMATMSVNSNGAPSRLSAEVRALARGTQDRSPFREDCHTKRISAACTLGAEGSIPTVAVWGDSHGVELAMALSELLAERDQSLKMLTYSSCPASIEYGPPEQPACPQFTPAVLEYLANHTEIETVFLAAYFAHYFEVSETDFAPAFEAAVDRLLSENKRVIIFEPAPFSVSLIPASAARNALARPGTVLTLSLDEYRQRNAESLELLSRLDEKPGVTVLRTSRALCSDGACPISVGRSTILFDRHHLSAFGARQVITELRSDIMAALAR